MHYLKHQQILCIEWHVLGRFNYALNGIKGCVCYIFASLFCMSKSELFRNKENAFYFTSKALLLLEIIKFWRFRNLNIMASSNAQAWKPKHILLNNLGSKCSLVMKFDQFMQYYKIIFHPRPSLIFKECAVKKILWRSACWFGQIVIDFLLHI